MVIYIDKTIAEYHEAKAPDDDLIDYFVSLISAHRKGYCFLCGHKSSIAWLERQMAQPVYRGVCKAILGQDSELRAIVERVEVVTVLSYVKEPALPSFFKQKRFVCQLPGVIDCCHLYNKCILLGENLRDAEFYEVIAKWYLATQEIKGIQLACTHRHGCGNSIDQVFQSSVETEKCPTLCLVDTDVKIWATDEHPNQQGLGTTATRAGKVKAELEQKCTNCVFELETLEIHEVENLIPRSIFSVLSTSNHLQVQTKNKIAKLLTILESMLKAGYGDKILYFDTKEGVDDASADCWQTIVEAVGSLKMIKYGDGLKDTLDYSGLKKRTEQELRELDIDDYLRPQWEKIGAIVFSWICANGKVRS